MFPSLNFSIELEVNEGESEFFGLVVVFDVVMVVSVAGIDWCYDVLLSSFLGFTIDKKSTSLTIGLVFLVIP